MKQYELICIACPKGCHLMVEEDKDTWHVIGNACIRGEAYGINEVVDPRRILTTTIRIHHNHHVRLPVVTSGALPKDMLMAAMDVINPLVVTPPVYVNQVIYEHILGTDINLVSSKTII